LNLAHLDWAILAILGISTLLSCFRGFVREALALGSWVVAIIVARWFADSVAAQLAQVIEVATVRQVVAYAGLIVATLIACGLLTRILVHLIKASGLSATDRLLGMLFGLLRGGLIVVMGVATLHYWSPVGQDAWWQASVLVPYVLHLIEIAAPLVIEQSSQLMKT
jgi:membrane protein required for colicin V production